MSFLAFAAAPLAAAGAALVAAAPGDTAVARVVPFEPEWFVRLADVLRLLLSVVAVALLAVLTVAAWKFRNTYDLVRRLLDRASVDVAPLTQRATRIAGNVDDVVSRVRSDVERVSALVSRTEQRLEETLARAEARARDLEALLDVAEAEARESLVAAASTVAAVREGFAVLRHELVGVARGEIDAVRDRGPRNAADLRTDDADEHAGALGADASHIDDAPSIDAEGGEAPAQPRIRTRRG